MGVWLNFKGTVSLDNDSGEPLPVECEVTDTRLIVTSRDGSAIGNWRIDELSVARNADDITVQVDGETLRLTVQEPESLAVALQATTGSGPVRPTSEVEATPVDSGQVKPAPQSQQNWHGIKRCTTGAKIPKGNRVMGNTCPFCGNTLGAVVASSAPTAPSVTDKLSNLNRLHDDALLSNEEYMERRSELLDEAVDHGTASSDPHAELGTVPRRKWKKRNTVLIVAAVIGVLVVTGLTIDELDGPEDRRTSVSASDDAVYSAAMDEVFLTGIRTSVGSNYPVIYATPDAPLLYLGNQLCGTIGRFKAEGTDPGTTLVAVVTTVLETSDDNDMGILLTGSMLGSIGLTLCPQHSQYIDAMNEFARNQ
jgi:hypothetical protein